MFSIQKVVRAGLWNGIGVSGAIALDTRDLYPTCGAAFPKGSLGASLMGGGCQ